MKRPAPYAVDWDKSDWGRSWIILDAPEDAWPSKVQGSPELTAVGSDDWTVSRMDEPAFGAGWTLPRKAFRELADRAVWRRALDDQRFSLAEFAGQTRIFRTMYMAELGASDESRGHRSQVGGWMVDATLAPCRRRERGSVGRPARYPTPRLSRWVWDTGMT